MTDLAAMRARTTSEASPAPGQGIDDRFPIGIVVVNYGSHRLLAENLHAAHEFGPDARVVVVDNFSGAAERAAVGALAHERGWELVPLPHNRGFAAATNVGVAHARALGCTTFLCLNPDARATPTAVGALRAQVLRRPGTMFSPLVVSSSGEEVFGGSRVSLRDGRIRGNRSKRPLLALSEPWLTGACLAVSAETWDRVGGLAESYFLYWEDVDLSHRALAAGVDLEVCRDVRVVHDEGGTHGSASSRAKSALYYRYNCRNRLLFAAQNLSRRQLLRWIIATPAVSWEILLRGGRRQLLASPRPLWAAVRGSAEGMLLALSRVARPARGTVSGTAPSRALRRVLLAHPGAELYGSDRVLLESVAALVTTDRVVVALPHDGPLAAAVRQLGAEVVYCPMPVLRKSALRPAGLIRLLRDVVRGLPPAVRLLRSAGRDGVYVSTVTIPSWVILGRLLRIPVVCHVHEAERAAAPLMRRLLALPVSWSSTVVVNSRFSEEVLLESVPGLAARTTMLRNGIPGPAAVVPARERLDGAVRLLYVGRLSPRKGPQVAVAALARLRELGVSARLELVGSVFPGYEWFERELRDAVRDAGLEDAVAFEGFHADVWPALAAADVVLVPSVVDEPFGNTAVEAVLAARPLLVSDSSGLREAAEGYRSARAVPPGDPAAWAAAVASLVTDWPQVRQQALADAEEARRRHAPEGYRAAVADLLHRSWAAR